MEECLENLAHNILYMNKYIFIFIFQFIFVVFCSIIGQDESLDEQNEKLQKEIIKTNTTPKIRGVSLGGWLVIEPWITPSLFENAFLKSGIMPIDEFTFCDILGKQEAAQILKQHWETFYVEEDFKNMKEIGINLIRIPIGYWAFQLLPNDPYVMGQQRYLNQAINYARKYSLRIQIDIHGMPGSQNGFDNSGKVTVFPSWLEKEEHMHLTYSLVKEFIEKYGSSDFADVMHSVEFVNEPFAQKVDVDKLEAFYNFTYQEAKNNNFTADLYYHDGFMPIHSWDWFLNDTNIKIDHHLYEIFSSYHVSLSIEGHLENVKRQGIEMSEQSHECIVGEFSGALTDCTKYINGVSYGARYDGTFPESYFVGSCEQHENFSNWSEIKKEDMKRFIDYQMNVFEESSNGWIYWCYKTENTVEWDFERLVNLNMIDLSTRSSQPPLYTHKSTLTPKPKTTSLIEQKVGLPKKNFAKVSHFSWILTILTSMVFYIFCLF